MNYYFDKVINFLLHPFFIAAFGMLVIGLFLIYGMRGSLW